MSIQKRVIPVLTVANEKLVKTIRFKKPNYIGDPVNAVKIFNDKMVDEIVLLDITATKEGREPNYNKIEEICSEAFMPFAYGGGISEIKQIQRLFNLGIEKVVLNSVLPNNMDLVKEAVSIFGSQSIIASVDVKRSLIGKKYTAYTNAAKNKVKIPLEDYLAQLQEAGIGELFLNSIDRDGTYLGYDLELVKKCSDLLDIPLVACGGASSKEDLSACLESGASAVGASSIFVYSSKGKGVLINYMNKL